MWLCDVKGFLVISWSICTDPVKIEKDNTGLTYILSLVFLERSEACLSFLMLHANISVCTPLSMSLSLCMIIKARAVRSRCIEIKCVVTLLNLPRVNTTSYTTSYGLQSFRYAAPQVCNKLSDNTRTSESLIGFKRAIHNIINNMHV